MSVPQAGLILCQQTRPNANSSYYAKAEEGTLTFPNLIAPVSILPANESTTASIYVEGADGPYKGAIQIAPGANSTIPESQPDGLTLRTVAGGVQVEVGTDGQAVNKLMIAGASGLSQVNDPVYNPQLNNEVVATFSGAIPANVGPGIWTYTPTVTGAYMLQVNFNVANADVIPPDGAIEWVLNVGGGEVQYCSHTLKSTSISKASDFNLVNNVVGTLAPPMDYSFSNLATLTAGQEVSFYLAVSSVAPGVWAVSNYQVRLVKMC